MKFSLGKNYYHCKKQLNVWHVAVILFSICVCVQGRKWTFGGSGHGQRSRMKMANIYVSLYEHENYRGKVHRQPFTKECTNLPRSFDDWASSVILHDRCVTLCEHRDCRGSCTEIFPNEKGKKRLSEFGLNDKVSSVKYCHRF